MTPQPIPYPADTKAKGWRFELDYESIDQSGTWALAAIAGQEARPFLLMQWYVAWRQSPCGSLPSDESVIAALIGINAKTWTKYRSVLMRGWWLAEDGLMYHPTITKRVLEMIEYRKKTAERVAKHKAVKREQHEGNALPTDLEQLRTTPEPEPINTSSLRSEVKPARASRKPTPPIPKPENVSEQTWADWLKLRKDKRASVTQTVINGAIEEAAKAGMQLEDFLKAWCRRGSQGLEADWLKPHERPQQQAFTKPPTAAQMAMAQACPALVAPHLRHLVEPARADTIDITEQVNAELKFIG